MEGWEDIFEEIMIILSKELHWDAENNPLLAATNALRLGLHY